MTRMILFAWCAGRVLTGCVLRCVSGVIIGAATLATCQCPVCVRHASNGHPKRTRTCCVRAAENCCVLQLKSLANVLRVLGKCDFDMTDENMRYVSSAVLPGRGKVKRSRMQMENVETELSCSQMVLLFTVCTAQQTCVFVLNGSRTLPHDTKNRSLFLPKNVSTFLKDKGHQSTTQMFGSKHESGKNRS